MKKNQFPLPCPLSHPLQTDSLHLLPSTSTMTQRSKSPAPDFKDLATAAEQLEIQLALAQLTMSVLKLQIAAATEEVGETKTRKTYAQATKTTPTVPQISTSSGDLQKEPSSAEDKTHVTALPLDIAGLYLVLRIPSAVKEGHVSIATVKLLIITL